MVPTPRGAGNGTLRPSPPGVGSGTARSAAPPATSGVDAPRPLTLAPLKHPPPADLPTARRESQRTRCAAPATLRRLVRRPRARGHAAAIAASPPEPARLLPPTTRTVPSGWLRIIPTRPRRTPSRCAAWRKKTPWTTPWTVAVSRCLTRTSFMGVRRADVWTATCSHPYAVCVRLVVRLRLLRNPTRISSSLHIAERFLHRSRLSRRALNEPTEYAREAR